MTTLIPKPAAHLVQLLHYCHETVYEWCRRLACLLTLEQQIQTLLPGKTFQLFNWTPGKIPIFKKQSHKNVASCHSGPQEEKVWMQTLDFLLSIDRQGCIHSTTTRMFPQFKSFYIQHNQTLTAVVLHQKRVMICSQGRLQMMYFIIVFEVLERNPHAHPQRKCSIPTMIAIATLLTNMFNCQSGQMWLIELQITSKYTLAIVCIMTQQEWFNTSGF